MTYCQLPVWSPIRGSALPRASLQALAVGPDPRTQLHSLLLQRFDAQGCILTARGTHALSLALSAATRARPDSPVLLPAYTCYEVATAAVAAGVRVMLYDLDPDTLDPDWDSVRAAGAEGASALVVAPLFGLSLNWDTARLVASELDVLLIEDAAQAHGSTWGDRSVGSFGDMTVLSFGRGKGWTGGGGGALLLRGAAATVARNLHPMLPAHRHRMLSEAKSAAALTAQWVLGRPRLYGLPSSIPFLALGETVYHAPTPTLPMTRSSAAILLAGDEAATREVLYRRHNAAMYSSWWLGSDHPTVVGRPQMAHDSGALRFPVRLRGGWSALKGTEAARLGVAPGYPATLRDLGALQTVISNPDARLSGAEVLVRELVTLPTHSLVTAHDRQRLRFNLEHQVVR